MIAQFDAKQEIEIQKKMASPLGLTIFVVLKNL
jgi:hypothetical protein